MPSGSNQLHTPHSPCHDIADILAFLIILVTARRQGVNRYPGVPSLLEVILRDSIRYFMVMFVGQFLFLLFLFFAPVGDG